ncbi:MAG: type II secretion system protein [Planctomycetota bacterium]
MNRRACADRGFTLIEAMLAVGLLFILTATAFPLMTDLVRTRDRVERRAEWLRARAATFDLLERALRTAAPVDGSGGAGFIGDAAGITIATRWQPKGSEPELGTLRFEFDRAELMLIVEQRSAQPRSAEQGSPERVSSQSNGEVRADAEPLAQGLERVQFRYHNGRSWSRSFQSGAGVGLPVAVEVSLWRERAYEPAEPSGPAGSASDRPPDAVRVLSIPDARPIGGAS